ncbi:MAG: hypothetical protein AMXMBFR58_02820 [Phycisphaerae bacterium]
MCIKSMLRAWAAAVAFAAGAAGPATSARADEGMWLLTNPPLEQLRSKYGFEPSSEWLDHVQKSCVRFSTGGSGSLVSGDGLVMTNHHVASDIIAKISTSEKNLLASGFYAAARDQEIPCPELELNILWTVEDVTDRVNAAVKPGMKPAEANAARERAIAQITSEAQDKSGLLPEVVALYQGGKYHLYSYKRYTDVRLVMAPEQDIASFGGDTDNFEYPRFSLDMCFFRIYENGRPLRNDHRLRWSDGSRPGDLAIVVGHPGRTSRLNTVEHLKFIRDVELPDRLETLWRAEVKLQGFSARNAEYDRIASEQLGGVANGRKALTGQLAGLLDPANMDHKIAAEKRLREFVDQDPARREQWGDAWDKIARAQQERRSWAPRYRLLNGGLSSELYQHARDIVRLAEELPKPNGDRLREYRESRLESLYNSLYSPAPIHPPLEIANVEWSLSLLAERLGADDPLVQTALAGKSPRARAEELVNGSALADPAARRALVEGGASAVAASKDPMIRLAAAMDPAAREIRKRYEDQVEAVERENYAKIAAAKFALEGESTYPDATFTLRMTFGPIEGYEQDGQMLDPYTDFAGLYQRYQDRKGKPGFTLPERWLEGKDKLDLSTPYNFVSSCDIIGGNSGSPVINTKGEVIGLVFDGNIQSLPGAFIYDGEVNRAVSVDSRAIIESLRKMYGATALVEEILAK